MAKIDPQQLAPFVDVLSLLTVAVVVSLILRPLRVSPILGYLIGGILIGPFGLGLIQDVDKIQLLAEFGVVFLLFTIGMELPIERLKVMRKLVFGLGLSQVLISLLIIGGIGYAVVNTFDSIVLIGGALALSSTALVLQLMVERGELSTQYGRSAFSTLLFQDLAVVPLIVVVPLLSLSEQSIMGALGLALANGILVMLIVFLAGRLIVRPLFRLIDATSNPELFTATSLLIVLATAGVTNAFGLSMALGGFLAGILMADSEYRHQVESDVQPFRGLLLGLFFMTVGMMIDVSHLTEEVSLILGLTFGLIALKTVLLAGIAYAFNHNWVTSFRYGVMLSQAGEFAFVILGLALTHSVLPPEVIRTLFLIVALSMLITPIYIKAMFPLIAKFDKPAETPEEIKVESVSEDRENHVIIAGFGRVGRTIARVLDAEKTPFIGVDMNHDRVAKARARKRPVFYGDVMRLPVWRSVGAEKAKAAVIAIEKPYLVSKVVGILREEFPNLKIFVRAVDEKHAEELLAAGVTESIPITFQASLELGASVLKSMGQSSEEISEVLDYVKSRYEIE